MQKRISDFIAQIRSRAQGPISVCFYGFGKTNKAIYEIIKKSHGIKEITVRQGGAAPLFLPSGVRRITDSTSLSSPDEHIVFASPSVRREKLSPSLTTVITSDTELFFEKTVGKSFLVSGSDGKSTVTTLSSLLLYPTFPDLFVGGNLGIPLASATLDCGAFVLELSSFNLRYVTPTGDRGALTNVTPNHLDWHGSLEEYEECKIKLLDSVRESVLNLDCPRLEKEARKRKSFALVSDILTHAEIVRDYETLHTVTVEGAHIRIDGEAALPITEVKRRERHNLTNLALAIALTLGYTTPEHVCKVARDFAGLPHRCDVFSIGGVEYVNSSIDTTPTRTKTTLDSLNKRVNLILGGRGKGLSYDELRPPILKYASRISLYGEVADEIYAWLDSDAELSVIPKAKFKALYHAIDHATDGISVGDTVLLSPAATSYGEFRDYAERGDRFKEYVSKKHSKI